MIKRFAQLVLATAAALAISLPAFCSQVNTTTHIHQSNSPKVLTAAPATQPRVFFLSAKPIWPKGREKEMNLFVGFRTIFPRPAKLPVVLRVTGSTIYRIWLNGQFIGHGPARGPHGYYRVDQWQLPQRFLQENNALAIEVAGYNVNSFYLLDQPSFLQAEVVSNDKVLASTAGRGTPFQAYIIKQRLQKVQRYTFQRTFIEYYRLSEEYGRRRQADRAFPETVECAVMPEKKLLPRGVAYPRFLCRQPVRHLSRGRIEKLLEVDKLWRDHSLTGIGPTMKGFTEQQLDVIPSIELQKVRSVDQVSIEQLYNPESRIRLGNESFHIFDFGTNLSGFVGLSVECNEPTRLFVTFDEILTNGDVDFKRLSCVNIISYELQPGLYKLESFEPYTLRYMKLIVLKGRCQINDLYLREYTNPQVWQGQFACSDDRLNRIFEAARETFRQNAVDIFMDCPSRERAGWLCDSFRTARVEFDLCGHNAIEQNFLENYLLAPQLPQLPKGMLPQCYPSDHYDGGFIPNWAMWFVTELEEYRARTGDKQLVNALEPKLLDLLEYFQGFENDDELLEDLQGWVFVEWSKANEWKHNVNYPTNMLYAETLAAMSRMYQRPDLREKAERIRHIIRKQSFNGEFFIDNALRKNGNLKPTGNRSESCQYYAFYYHTATPDSHAKLWKTLLTKFGPDRDKNKTYPDVVPANTIIGNWMRLELLARYGCHRQLKDELIGYFLYMADATGTIWENVGAYASCNHGFASHVAHNLYRDILGIHHLDAPQKIIRIHFNDVGLQWCRGRMPIPGGFVSVNWWKGANKLHYHADVPAGYELTIENNTNLQLVR